MFRKENNRTFRNTVLPLISASPLISVALLNGTLIKILQYFIIT